MIRVTQCKIPCGEDRAALEQKLRGILRISGRDWEKCRWKILRHSVDARKKPVLFDVYTVSVSTPFSKAVEEKLVRKCKSSSVTFYEEAPYRFPAAGEEVLSHRPVVIGAGPAGLFCALFLAEHGYRPLVLERGASMEERVGLVNRFWETGQLDPETNVQFGEGGAGTFSDGKLNTQVKDPTGRIREVLEIFVQAGAPGDILYESLPHIGTDRLREVIPAIRKRIIQAGGTVRFGAKVTGFGIREGVLEEITVNDTETIPCEVCVLAPGHSARDTIRTLLAQGVPMEAKNFAVGMRVTHPQALIDQSQYGLCDPAEMERLHLTPAPYKLTAKASSGRGVYTFCMCPGGFVVNASSEEGRLAVNGMSDLLRGSGRANSAVVMTIGPEDYGSGILDGLYFQEELEEKAFRMGNGMIPGESYEEFRKNYRNREEASREDTILSSEELCVKGRVRKAPLHLLFPEEMAADFVEGMEEFDQRIKGFAGKEAFVLGLESRTSSPVRICREASLESEIRGLYPCGEGAGYAGGITSAAVDGIRIAEAVAKRFAPFHSSQPT